MNSKEKNIYSLDIESRILRDELGNLEDFHPEKHLEECVHLIVNDMNLPADDV